MRPIKLLLIFALFVGINIQLMAQISAETAINQLKNGALIVKLIVPEKKMAILESQGKTTELAELKAETEKVNDSLIAAFSKHYHFSTLYFLYSNNLRAFLSDSAGVLFTKTGEVATQMPKSWLYLSLTELPDVGTDGFVITDAEFNILRKPFPYFVSQYKGLHTSKFAFADMIDIWQGKLERYYQKKHK